MKKSTLFILLWACLFATFTISCKNSSSMSEVKAPIAKKVEHKLEKHGDTRIDPYYWMRDREDQEVIDYLNAENAYTESVMAPHKQFQEDLYQEMIARLKPDDSSVPYKLKDYYYYSRFAEGKEYPLFCRKKESLEAEEEIMLDVNELAEGQSFCQVGGLSISPNQRFLAYGVDFVGRRIYSIRIKDLQTGEILSEEIKSGSPISSWAADDRTLFYAAKDLQTLRTFQIKRHTMGTDPSKDVLIYEEKDETFSCYITKSKSRAYLMIVSAATLTTEFQYLKADDPQGTFTVLEPRKQEHEYNVEHFGDHFYILTNDQAENYRLMRTPISKPGMENWEEIIAHRKEVVLEDMELFRDFLVLEERKDGLTLIRIIPWEGDEAYYLEFDDPAYTAYTTTNPDFDTDQLRYGYQSLTRPNSTFEINMKTQERKLLKQQPVLGDFDPENYVSERIYVPARDGKRIPMSLVRHKNTPVDGSAPLLLYAYGSYGSNVDPYFSSARLSLLDRGFSFAIAHIRGGATLGREWYENGRLLKKKNTFLDFIDCGQYLVDSTYTTSDQLYCMGGSAGGLLIGAVVNMAPELFRGGIAAVPFVDVVTTMLDEDIPLTTGEYREWGNPNEKEYYDYMLSYSPYDNVEAKSYPDLLITSGLHDSQVQYWEPTKWAAKLRDMKTDSNLLLLHTNMEAGHGGASGRYQAYKETALEYTFLLMLAEKIDA
ncbi:MAG: S9 family peptidase [Bacteroidota bacterium]